MTAKVQEIDFSRAETVVIHPMGVLRGGRPGLGSPRKDRHLPRTADGKLLTAKAIRNRMRRKIKRTEIMTEEELAFLYRKPVSEWDLEELARGRPKDAEGHFHGPKPKWITTAMHEESMTRYTAAVKAEMNTTTVDALGIVKWLINDDERDSRGKPLVAPSTKLEAAKFLIEHVVGKPTQRLEQDVSVKLQGILGQVMVNPTEVLNGQQVYELGHLPGVTIPMGAMEDNEGLDDNDLL